MKDRIKPNLVISILSLLTAIGVFLFGNNILNENSDKNIESVDNQISYEPEEVKSIRELRDEIQAELGIRRHDLGLPQDWYLPKEIIFDDLIPMKTVILDQNINIDSYRGLVQIGGVNRSILSIGGRNLLGEDLEINLNEDNTSLEINGNKEPFYLEFEYKKKFISIDVSAHEDIEMTIKFKSIDTSTIELKKFSEF